MLTSPNHLAVIGFVAGKKGDLAGYETGQIIAYVGEAYRVQDAFPSVQ